jgi:phosphoserine phosphatase
MNHSAWPLVTVDIDGTLTTVHGWLAIADAFGRRPQFEATQRRYFAREVMEDEHLEAMLDVASGRTLAEVESALEATPRIRGIRDGIRTLHAHGSRVALLTHNPPYIGNWYRRSFGFDDFEGTVGQEVVAGIVQRPHGIRADKLGGLRALTARMGVPAERVVHIGDGWADARVFRLVGRGIALNSSLPDVERAADLALRTDDFREVVAALEALPPRR